MKIDLHVHTSEYSSCAVSPLATQIEAARMAGLDAVALTNHQTLCTFDEAAEISAKYKFKVFSGIEIHCSDYGEDFIVLGLNDNRLSSRKWQYEDLFDFVRENKGFIFFCHPYRYNDNAPRAIYKRVPDAVEIRSTNITARESKKAQALAAKLGVRTLTNSDSHYAGNIGIYYNDLAQSASTDEEMINILRAGTYSHGENTMIKNIWEG